MTRALELWRSDQSSAMELGLAVLAVRAALHNRHGAFKKWWQDNKLSQARVSYCMRLASGKVATAKAQRRTMERIVVGRIKKDVAGFLKFCTDSKQVRTLDEIERATSNLVLLLIGGISGLKHWPIDLADAGVIAAEENFKQSLTEFLDAAFRPANFDDLDRIHPDRIQAYVGPTTAISPAQFKSLLLKLRRQGMPTKPKTA